ncbi:hypothetical protein [Williamsia sp. 1135]|uniref:hypothetical protein n=1 Tax=Williamsia sp. 1135 TaxID=1889262 RepID=UPI000A0FA8EA|nr:hypothetical protein [Williamsia sp. 1135]ORM26835.1 hypothetical protein BFL43_22405 [Williamsia sp. 1135]
MFWMLIGASAVVATVWLSSGGNGLDYRAREIRASMARRDAQDNAQLRRIRWARRRQNLLHLQ